jgi:hypothetical protein
MTVEQESWRPGKLAAISAHQPLVGDGNMAGSLNQIEFPCDTGPRRKVGPAQKFSCMQMRMPRLKWCLAAVRRAGPLLAWPDNRKGWSGLHRLLLMVAARRRVCW